MIVAWIRVEADGIERTGGLKIYCCFYAKYSHGQIIIHWKM